MGWLLVCFGLLLRWDVLQVGLFDGCLAGWAMPCGVRNLWCVLWYAVVYFVMSCMWVHMYLPPGARGEGRGS